MALDILHDNWGPYTHTEVENALKAYLSGLEDRINQAIQSGGVGLTDLSAEVQALLNKADTALQSETDPTVPNWAKQSNKPTYNVSEIIFSSNRPLSSKLDEMAAEILAAGATDSEMSDSSKKPVQNKVIKAYVDGLIQGLQNVLNTITQDGATQGVIDTFNEVKAFLEGINNQETLAAKLATLVPQTRTINGKALSSNVTIGMSDIQGLVDAINNAGSGAVSVTTNQDGTFVIHVGSTDYTINLNHTHESMAKLIVCEESDLPSTLDMDTIYAITDSGETEIEKLIIRGMEFAGGGIPDTGEPMISSPSNGSTINLGDNTSGQGVSKTITIKGKNLTGDLTVTVGTGLTISYGQSTGQSSVTIPMAQALLGAQVTIAYSGSGALDDGSLVISQGNDVLSSVVVVVPTPEEITAVKFTGSQWLETDYYPNPNTEFELDCQFVANSHTTQSGVTPNGPCPYFLSCEHEGDNRFNFQVGSHESANTNAYRICCYNNNKNTRCEITAFQALADQGGMLVRSKLEYKKASSNMSMTFNNASSSNTVPFKTNTMLSKLAIGYSYYFADEFNTFDLIIYGFKIKENGVTIKDYRPALYNGVPGLYDYENDDFISSKTSTELVAITN